MEEAKVLLNFAKKFKSELEILNKPPEEGLPAKNERVILFSLVRHTRGYIEKIVHQINGSYDSGWYDSCAVMIRRLIETLIIECFEAHQIANKIKNASGDFLYLTDLINATLCEPSWNLGRNTKKALKNIKDIGDKSAHSRRFIAHRQDIEKHINDLRVSIQELVFIAGLK